MRKIRVFERRREAERGAHSPRAVSETRVARALRHFSMQNTIITRGTAVLNLNEGRKATKIKGYIHNFSSVA